MQNKPQIQFNLNLISKKNKAILNLIKQKNKTYNLPMTRKK